MTAPARDLFTNFLCLSFFIHCAFALYFFIDPQIGFFSKKHTYIKEAIRVDSIGLPELEKKWAESKTKSVKPAPKLKKTIKPAVKKKPKKKKKVIKKTPKLKQKAKRSPPKKSFNKQEIQKQQSEAMDKLRALEKIDEIKREVEETSYKGAKISKGNSRSGQEVQDFEMLKFFTNLTAHINMYWNLPQELASRNLRASIYVQIGNNGAVLKKYIEHSSGSEEFDARVLETIERASPFPPPPPSVQKQLSQGVVFGFPQ